MKGEMEVETMNPENLDSTKKCKRRMALMTKDAGEVARACEDPNASKRDRHPAMPMEPHEEY